MTNSYEYDEDFVIDEELAQLNCGADVKVHIGLGQADIACEENFDALTSHKPDWDAYLHESKREANIVDGDMVGLAFRNGEQLEGAVIVSRPIS